MIGKQVAELIDCAHVLLEYVGPCHRVEDDVRCDDRDCWICRLSIALDVLDREEWGDE